MRGVRTSGLVLEHCPRRLCAITGALWRRDDHRTAGNVQWNSGREHGRILRLEPAALIALAELFRPDSFETRGGTF
jgi:hypothetical protein